MKYRTMITIAAAISSQLLSIGGLLLLLAGKINDQFLLVICTSGGIAVFMIVTFFMNRWAQRKQEGHSRMP